MFVTEPDIIASLLEREKKRPSQRKRKLCTVSKEIMEEIPETSEEGLVEIGDDEIDHNGNL